jgi:hypothetical protein
MWCVHTIGGRLKSNTQLLQVGPPSQTRARAKKSAISINRTKICTNLGSFLFGVVHIPCYITRKEESCINHHFVLKVGKLSFRGLQNKGSHMKSRNKTHRKPLLLGIEF